MPKTELAKDDFEVFWRMTVRYYELDLQGIVHNSNHAAFYDQATLEYFKYIGYDYEDEVEKSNHDFHAVRITIEYYRPLYFEDEVEIGLKIKEIGNSSFTFIMGMFLTSSGELVGTCEAIWVYTDLKTKKSTPIPEEQKTKLLGK